jgi:hypothetical protein
MVPQQAGKHHSVNDRLSLYMRAKVRMLVYLYVSAIAESDR